MLRSDVTADTEERNDIPLAHFDHFPKSLLTTSARDLVHHLSGPSLFHIEGRAREPLFVSVMLHGNEDTGWQAMQRVMAQHEATGLPRSLLLFVGNVRAAAANVRSLPDQADYNRTWPGTPLASTPEARLMRRVVEEVRKRSPFASIDIHNNTGHNPHYACLNRLDEPFLHLARLFSRTVVYFKRPEGVQSAALAEICPAVTIECGRPSGLSGAEHAAEFVSSALALSHFPSHPVAEGDLDLLQTFAIVKVPATASFSYFGEAADFRFRGDLDRLNFSELEPGEHFGDLGDGSGLRLDVQPGGDHNIDSGYFTYEDRSIVLARRAIPAMLTLDPNAVRLDCLGYLMHRIGRDGARLPD